MNFMEEIVGVELTCWEIKVWRGWLMYDDTNLL